MKFIWNYFNCKQLHKNYLSLRDVVLYCGLKSTPEDLVQVYVMPTVVNFLWPCSPFSSNIESHPKITEASAVSSCMSSTAKHRF